jgi:hypothetical protein
MAQTRLDGLGTGDRTVAYLDPDPTDPLVAHCVEVVLPVAKLAFGNRTQLLRAQLTETLPGSTDPPRSWHRDLPVDASGAGNVDPPHPDQAARLFGRTPTGPPAN